MKRATLFVLPAHLALASLAPLAFAQATATKPVTAPAKRPATTASGPKLPPGVPPVRGIVRTAFALKYEEIKIGTGKPAEPGQLYKVHYTGWLASDGKKFDSSFDHKRPVLDKDGKPEKNEDGTPKLGEAEPIQFPQGRRGVIPGWDQGFAGMKVGGKRRLFIPYQLAYGEQGRPPVIPAKSDLIFDIELIDVTDAPAMPQRPGMPTRPGAPMPGMRPGGAPGSTPGSTPGTPGATPAPPTGQPATQPTTPPPANPAKPTDPTQPTTAPNSSPAPSTPPPPATTSPTAPPDKPANPAQPQR